MLHPLKRLATPPLALLFTGLLIGSVVVHAEQQSTSYFSAYRTCMAQAVREAETATIAVEEEYARAYLGALEQRLHAYQDAWQERDEKAITQATRAAQGQFRKSKHAADKARNMQMRSLRQADKQARSTCKQMRKELEQKEQSLPQCGNDRCERGEDEICPQDCAPVGSVCGDGRCEGKESGFGCDPSPDTPNLCADHIYCPEDCSSRS